MLCLLLGVMYLVVGMTAGQGLPLTESDRAELAQRVTLPDDIARAQGIALLTDHGILPLVWGERHHVWGRPLAGLYQRVPWLQTNGTAIFLLAIFGGLFAFLRGMCESRMRVIVGRAALSLVNRIRHSIHRQNRRVGPSDLEGHDAAATFALFTTQAEALRQGVFSWAEVWLRDPLRIAVFFVVALVIHPTLALQIMIPLAGCFFLANRVRWVAEEQQTLLASLAENDLRMLAESLSQTRLVRGFAMEEFEQQQFEKHLQRWQTKTETIFSAGAWPRRGLRFLTIASLALAIFLVVGRIAITPRDVTLAAGILMLATIASLARPLVRLQALDGVLAPARKAATSIQLYLNRIPDVGQAVGAKFLNPLSQSLEIEDVRYVSPSKRCRLNGLTLKIAAGKKVAFVSTDPLEAQAAAALIPRFIEPQSGRISIDGEDIGWVTLESLRAESLYVGGNAILTGTVRDNIAGGRADYTLQEVGDAAKLAHAHQFILKLPQGYETIIGQQGETLEPSQVFRLALARAALRKPALMIIEEPTDPIDDATRALIDDAYTRLCQNRTVIFLPHRMTTIRRADFVVFIHKGVVEAMGDHASLVRTSPLYRHWEYVTFSEFRHEFEPGQNP